MNIPSRENLIPLLHEQGLDLVTDFQEQHMKLKKTSSPVYKEPGRYYLNQVIKENITSDKSYWYHVPTDVMRKATHLCGIHPQKMKIPVKS